MSLGPNDLVAALEVGAGATLLMDLWNLFLKRAFGIASLDFCLLGRWLLALAFVALAPSDWLDRPTLPPALLYGIVTVVFPLFVLQPALGLGMASARAPNPRQARLKSLATHSVFGVGLYLCAQALAFWARLGG
jgi:hypothetical protein